MIDQKELYDLIAQAQKGDVEATDKVLDAYRPLAKYVARSYYLKGADAEDVLQIATIGLFRAVQTYRFDCNASFKTYATNCMRNLLLDEIRKSKPNEVEPLAIDDFEDILPTDTPENAFIEKEASESLESLLADVLKPMEANVLKLYMESLSYEEIALQLGIERKKVDNTLYAIKKKLRNITNLTDIK